MNDDFTTTELATLSEEEAVARQFDAHNARIGRWFSLVVAGMSFGLFLAAAGERWLSAVVALAGMLIAAAMFLTLRRVVLGTPGHQGRDRFLQPNVRLFHRSPRAFILSWLLASFLLVVAGAYGIGALAPLVITLGMFVVGFRLRAVERTALYLSVIGLCIAVILLGGAVPIEETSEELPATIGNLAFALGIGLLVNRRVRRTLLTQFRQRREPARRELRMQQELSYAREIQLSMLPAECPPQGWLDICSLSLPATEVGGDYYDFFPLPGERLAVVVGDVAGHGMASGLMLAGVRSCLTILVEELDQPLAVLAKLNRMVQQTARRRMLVTLAIVVLDRERRAATIASAGHPPALWVRNGLIKEVGLPALPLGTRLEPAFGQHEVALAKGDTLLLLSDGLYEAVGAGGDPYGLERLQEVLARQPVEASASQIQAALVGDLTAFRRSAPQSDDVTFVVVKVLA